jgi:hypothetical protein
MLLPCSCTAVVAAVLPPPLLRCRHRQCHAAATAATILTFILIIFVIAVIVAGAVTFAPPTFS